MTDDNWVYLCELEAAVSQPVQVMELPNRHSVILVVVAGEVRVYDNRCPHAGVRLDMDGGKIESLDQASVFCTMHGAQFSKKNGYCHWGPCRGESLLAIESRVSESKVFINHEFLNDDMNL